MLNKRERIKYENNIPTLLDKYEYLYDNKNRITTILTIVDKKQDSSNDLKNGIEITTLSYDDAKNPFNYLPYYFTLILEHNATTTLLLTNYNPENNITCIQNTTNYTYIDYTYNSQKLPLTATVYHFENESYVPMSTYNHGTYTLFDGFYTVFEFQYTEIEITE